MGDIYTNSKRLCASRYSTLLCVIMCISIVFNCTSTYAYGAISPAMSDFISEEEETIQVNYTAVSDVVTQTIEATNQSKFYEVILNEECDVNTVNYTESYLNYASTVADKVFSNKAVYDDTSGTAIIQDKTKSLSVVGINEFNVKLKYGIKLSEMELFYKIVQAEAGCEDLKGKILVANVILNRVKSSKFPNTIRGVVMAPGQFQPVTNGKIYTVKVSSETRLAVTMALQGEDYSNGALYFMARSASSRGNVTWFDRALTRVVKHGNHEFFK